MENQKHSLKGVFAQRSISSKKYSLKEAFPYSTKKRNRNCHFHNKIKVKTNEELEISSINYANKTCQMQSTLNYDSEKILNLNTAITN